MNSARMVNQIVKTFSTLLYVFLCVCLVMCSSDTTETTWKAVEHKTLLVPCNTTQRDDIEIYWTKNETNNQFYQTGSNLMFTDIVRGDSGGYICHAFNTSLPGHNETNRNVTVEVINVEVLYPAEITEFSLGPTVITENDTFSVSVNVQGNPGPTWEIRNNHTGEAILQVTDCAAGATLFGNHVRCGDTGFWECTAYNELNHHVNVTRGQHLTVLCPPRLNTSSKYEQTILASVGDSFFFSIYVIGYPYPSYHWSRDDGRPMPDWTQLDSPGSSTLSITNITAEDFTSYTLTIYNTMGTYSAPFELKAHGRPLTPYDLTHTDVTYNSVNLSWKSGFDMGSTEHFIVMKLVGNEFIQISDLIYETYGNNGIGHEWTYTLTNLYSNTEYNLTVVAENDDGFMSHFAMNPVSFKTEVNPYPPTRDLVAEANTRILILSLIGGLSFVAVLAFMVYMMKYRNMRTSYLDLKGEVIQNKSNPQQNEKSYHQNDV